jgi:hypothetical protein
MLIPVGFAQVNHVFGGPGLPRGAQVAYGVSNTGPGNGAYTAPEMAAFCHSVWISNLIAKQSSNTTLLETRVKFGPNSTGADATFSDPKPGTDSPNQDSPQVCALIRKRTPFGGKTGKGRMFFPGINEGQTDVGGTLSNGVRDSLQVAFDAFLTALDTGGATMQLLHTAGTLPAFVVTKLEVQKTLATQKRRLR